MSKLFRFAIVLAILCLCGCSAEPQEGAAQPPVDEIIQGSSTTVQNVSLEEAVKLSDCAVLGEYVDTVNYGSYIEHEFKVESCLYGDVTDERIYLCTGVGSVSVVGTDISFSLEDLQYEKGKSYLIIANRYRSIMLEHDRYVPCAHTLICPEDNLIKVNTVDAALPEGESDILSYIKSLPNSYSAELNTPLPNASDYDSTEQAMAAVSDFVARVKVKELFYESDTHNGDTYVCDVIELYSGGSLNYSEDGDIYIVVLKGMVSPGEEYIIGFSPADDNNSVIYVQDIRDGVLPYSPETAALFSEIQ